LILLENQIKVYCFFAEVLFTCPTISSIDVIAHRR